jgi:penicillin-binding protein 1C
MIDWRSWHTWRRAGLTGLGALLGSSVLLVVILSVGLELPAELSRVPPPQSVRFEDREGRLLREVRSSGGQLSQWESIEQIPPWLRDALVAVEDRRFHLHPGVDPLATLRAVGHSAFRGRVVSGASTLSMQLARLVRPHPRNLLGKLYEMALALRIEASLSKPQILEQYLNRVDFGPNLRGVASASQGYFGKPLGALSRGEMALLVGLPQSPSSYAPDRALERAVARRRVVIETLFSAGLLSAKEAEIAKREAVALRSRSANFGAPHFVTALRTGTLSRVQPGLIDVELSRATRITTTIDSTIERAAEIALSSTLSRLTAQHVTSGAVLVIENETGDVVAYVGSPDFYDAVHQGQVDGVRALRQPGSTLKPFVYAAAFEKLGYTAASVLPDLELTLETEAGPYSPRNFDDKFRGPVRLREALGNSLNIPAVQVAMRLGAPSLLGFLHRLGFASLREAPEFYGPALALGDGEVTLLELVRAYVTLARGGSAIPLRVVSRTTVLEPSPSGPRTTVKSFAPGRGEPMISNAHAAVLTDVLKDDRARRSSFGARSALSFDFDVAAKTGTSKGYRDNWVVGFTDRYTVGVWVGNFDGSPMQQVSGITGAGPIFRAVIQAVTAPRGVSALPLPKWDEPAVLRVQFGLRRVEICPISGGLRGEHCPHGVAEYVPNDVDWPSCPWHRELVLDGRNGLLAGRNCPVGVLRREVFEVFDREYDGWARTTGRRLPPRDFSPFCPAAEGVPGRDGVASSDSVQMRIAYPREGSRFVLDPERPLALQRLHVEIEAPASSQALTLWVDDVEVQRSSRPFTLTWPLVPGVHRLRVTSDDGSSSAPVSFEVRAAEP